MLTSEKAEIPDTLPITSENGVRMRKTSEMQTDPMSWRTQRRLSLEDTVGREVNSMLGNTSCLALGNIFIRRHPVLKTLWCIAFVICSIFTIRQLYNLSANFFSYPVSTVMELRFATMEYPSVTFCNLNPLLQSKVNETASPELKTFLQNIAKRNFTKDNGTEIETREADWKEFRLLISNESSVNRVQMGHQMNDFILQCSFDGRPCNSANLFTPSLSSTYGNCFTFNSYVHFNRTPPLIPRAGRDNGLVMTLFIEHDEYLRNFVPSAGIRMHIHEARSYELPEIYGFAVPPGFETSLGLSVDKIIRLSHPYGNCTTGSKFEQEHQISYTMKSCQIACHQKMVQQVCHCYDKGNNLFKRNTTLKECSTRPELECLNRIKMAKEKTEFKCQCAPSCEEFRYHMRQSLSEWPADNYEDRIFGDLFDMNPKITSLINKSRSLARRNLINIIIYQEDTYYNEIRQKKGYEWDNYLSDIGGTLSLFLGFSVLTGFEFIEGLCLLITYLAGKVIYRDNEEESDEIKLFKQLHTGEMHPPPDYKSLDRE